MMWFDLMASFRDADRESGLSMIEYAIIMSILMATFIFFGQQLAERGEERANASVEAVQEMSPCGADLAGSPEHCY